MPTKVFWDYFKVHVYKMIEWKKRKELLKYLSRSEGLKIIFWDEAGRWVAEAGGNEYCDGQIGGEEGGGLKLVNGWDSVIDTKGRGWEGVIDTEEEDLMGVLDRDGLRKESTIELG